MINFNQEPDKSNGVKESSALLKHLYKMKSDSKFGVYLSQQNESKQSQLKLEVGDIGIVYCSDKE